MEPIGRLDSCRRRWGGSGGTKCRTIFYTRSIPRLLDGEVHGDVSCVALVLGDSATLEGNVTAEDVVIRGHLIGSVKALRVTLQATSHVEGDIYHQSLALEQGAYFEGRSRRCDDPMGLGGGASANGAAAKASEPAEPAEAASHRKDKPTHKFNRSLPESRSV